MATEGPLVRDGAQCTALQNYYNPAVPFLGVGGSAQFLIVSLQAARILQIAPSKAVAPYGVLQNTPMAGEACDVAIAGITKVVAGAAFAFGVELMAGTGGTLGQAIQFSSPGYKVGLALEASGAQGAVISMLVYSGGIIL